MVNTACPSHKDTGWRFIGSLSLPLPLDQEGSSQEDTLGVSSTSRTFSDNFAPTKEEGEKEGGVVVKEEEMMTSSSTEEEGGHVKREGGHVKREGGGGGSDGDREVVRLGKKRSAAIASLRTPAMKQQR